MQRRAQKACDGSGRLRRCGFLLETFRLVLGTTLEHRRWRGGTLQRISMHPVQNHSKATAGQVTAQAFPPPASRARAGLLRPRPAELHLPELPAGEGRGRTAAGGGLTCGASNQRPGANATGPMARRRGRVVACAAARPAGG